MFLKKFLVWFLFFFKNFLVSFPLFFKKFLVLYRIFLNLFEILFLFFSLGYDFRIISLSKKFRDPLWTFFAVKYLYNSLYTSLFITTLVFFNTQFIFLISAPILFLSLKNSKKLFHACFKMSLLSSVKIRQALSINFL